MTPLQLVLQSIDLGNNGYADIGTSVALAAAVQDAGYPVILARDLHGNPVLRGYTPRAWAIRCRELTPQTALPIRQGGTARGDLSHYTFDAEAAILARQEAAGWYY